MRYEDARIRYKLDAKGRVAFVRVDAAGTVRKPGWHEVPTEDSPIWFAPAYLAAAHGFADANVTRRLIVEMMRLDGFAEAITEHDDE